MNVHEIQTPDGNLMVYHPKPAYVDGMLTEYRMKCNFKQINMASVVLVNISRDANEFRYVIMKDRFFNDAMVEEYVSKHWVKCRAERNHLIDCIMYQGQRSIILVVDDPDELVMMRLKHG